MSTWKLKTSIRKNDKFQLETEKYQFGTLRIVNLEAENVKMENIFLKGLSFTSLSKIIYAIRN